MVTDAVSLRLEKITEQHAESLYSYMSDLRLYEYLEDQIPTFMEVRPVRSARTYRFS